MLNWVDSWMSPLPLWLQFIIGISGLITTVILIAVFPRWVRYWWNKLKDLNDAE